MAWRVSRRLFHGNPGREGRTPSHLGDAPSSKRGRPGVLLGARGLLLGGPSSELGECTSVGRAWVPELVVCLKLLGPCPKKTGAAGVWAGGGGGGGGGGGRPPGAGRLGLPGRWQPRRWRGRV